MLEYDVLNKQRNPDYKSSGWHYHLITTSVVFNKVATGIEEN
jgi:hypothetical protein